MLYIDITEPPISVGEFSEDISRQREEGDEDENNAPLNYSDHTDYVRLTATSWVDGDDDVGSLGIENDFGDI